MKIRKTNIDDNDLVKIVDEEYVLDFVDRGYFDVDNALELIKNGDRIYSNFSYFEKIEE